MAVDKNNPMFPGFDVESSPVDVELQPPTTMDPTSVTFDEEGGALIDFNPPGSMAHGSPEFTKNIAEEMDDGELAHLSSELIGQYQIDKESRADWEQTYIKGLDLLGFKMEDRSQPFQGASGVSHPLLAESITQFQAQAYKELLPSGGPVRTQVIGEKTDDTTAQSERVKDFMNYQITHVMEEFDPELDQMLFYLPLSGSSFKKIYYDQNLKRAVSKFIPSEDLVVPYLATDLDSCERVTHVIKMMNNDLRKHQVSGFYKDVELEPYQLDEKDLKEAQRKLEGTQKTTGSMEQHQILEFHVLLDLPGFEDKDEKENETGIKSPYIVTIHEDSGQIIGIRRNWREENDSKDKIPYFVHFKFLPGLGFYGFGLIHMLGGLSKTATSALRQLLDAGTLSNLPAGFKAKGLRLKDEDEPLQPGEWRDVDAGGQTIRDSLMPLPYKEPSVTLFNLLGFCVEAGRRFAAIADLQIGEGNQNAPVGTTIAMLERGTKVMSAIHKRLHCAQKAEFNLLAIVFRDYLPPEYPYSVVGGERTIKAEDFDDRVDILPVSDPNIFSMAQRISMAQTQLQMAQVAPEIHNMFEAYKRMYHALGVENIEAILPTPAKEMPRDPAAENAASLKMEQLRAFMGQNHDDHMQAHLAFMMSPLIAQNPPVQGSLQAHLMEHIGLKAREEVESNMQQSMDPNAPPELMQQAQAEAEKQIASRIAKYTGEVIGQLNEAMGKLGQDPLIALKDKELGIKSQDVQRKTQADQSKQQLEQSKLGAKVQSDENKTDTQEDIAKLRAQVQYDKMSNENRKTNAKMIFDKMKEDGKQQPNDTFFSAAEGGEVQGGEVPGPEVMYTDFGSKRALEYAQSLGRPEKTEPPYIETEPPYIEKKEDISDIAPSLLEIEEEPAVETEKITTKLDEDSLLKSVRKENFSRFEDVINEKDMSVVLNKVANFIGKVESDNRLKVKNKFTTASGIYQFTNASAITAANNVINTLGRENVPSWVTEVSKGEKRVTALNKTQQQVLFEADMFQKKGSDELLKQIFQGNTAALTDYYYRLHHTNPDDATIRRVERLAKNLNLLEDTEIVKK